jgi:5-oxoprolinase (ATP-hydrolysing) subunit B
MKPRIEVVGIDCLMLRLFDEIDETHMPWLLAATRRLREAFGGALLDLVPSYTTLLVHYDLRKLDDDQARQRVAEALHDLQPDTGGQVRELNIPVWYDPSVGPELEVLGRRSGLGRRDRKT